MKKFFKVASILSLCLSGMTSIYAEDYNYNSSDEITIEEMFEQAKANAQYNIEPISLEDNLNVVATITSGDGETKDVEIYKYEPDSYYLNDEVSETYVLAASPRASSSSSSNVYDQYGIVYGKITITYNYKATSPYQYLLTYVSGSWSSSDSSITLKNREVIYSCQGTTSSGSFQSSQRNVKYPSGNSFSYSTGYATYVKNDGLLGAVGAVSYIDMADQYGSKWSLEVRSELFNYNNIGSSSKPVGNKNV